MLTLAPVTGGGGVGGVMGGGGIEATPPLPPPPPHPAKVKHNATAPLSKNDLRAIAPSITSKPR
jgi:hypothetical protein